MVPLKPVVMKKNKSTVLVFALLLFFVSVSTLFARDVFVNTSAQLASACSNALSGDVIKIGAGTYTGPFNLLSKSGVTLRSYNGTVYLQGNPAGSATGIIILYIQNSSNIVVDGLKFTQNWGNYADGIQVRGAGNALNISNCEFYNIGWSTSKTTLPNSGQTAHAIVVVGSSATSYTNIFIGGNTIHDCITGYSESITLVGNVSNFLIEGNTLYGNTNIGIDCAGFFAWTGAPDNVNYARSGIIRKNTVRDYAGPAALDAAGGIYVDGGSYITVENNTVYNYKVGFSVGCEATGRITYGNIVRDNLVYNCSLSGIFVGSNQSTSSVQNTRITNNTFYKNGTGIYDNGQIAFQNNGGTIVQNNILYPTNFRFALVQMGGTTTTSSTINYNLYYRDNANLTSLYYNINGDANAVKSNPLFVNASSYNLHINTNSPAVNTGVPGYVSGVGEADLDGNARVQSGRVDIGVDEIGGAAARISTDLSVVDASKADEGYAIEESVTSIYPNPSHSILTVEYVLLKSTYVSIDLYDLTGRLVRNYQDGIKPAGPHTNQLDVSDLAGFYVAKVRKDSKVENQKVVIK
jgi:ribosomal protein S8E